MKDFMENTKEVSLETQLYGARREFALRERCYPKWVAQGKMSGAKAAHELKVMAAIVETLKTLVEAKGPIEIEHLGYDSKRAS